MFPLTNLLPEHLKPSSIAIHLGIYAILFLIITYYIKREWRYTSNRTRNKYILNPDELVPAVSYYSYPVEEIQHVFWSGGLNSTALLCYYFIVLGKPVQPIFINYIQQDSQIMIQRQQYIRRILLDRYPHLQSRLLPTWYVTSIDLDRNITSKVKDIQKEKPTLDMNTLKCWDALARFARTYSWPISAGNISSSGLFTISPGLYEKIFVTLLDNKLVFPQAGMSENNVKVTALDSKNYYWDILSSSS
jgi:hypothetical protein